MSALSSSSSSPSGTHATHDNLLFNVCSEHNYPHTAQLSGSMKPNALVKAVHTFRGDRVHLQYRPHLFRRAANMFGSAHVFVFNSKHSCVKSLRCPNRAGGRSSGADICFGYRFGFGPVVSAPQILLPIVRNGLAADVRIMTTKFIACERSGIWTGRFEHQSMMVH